MLCIGRGPGAPPRARAVRRAPLARSAAAPTGARGAQEDVRAWVARLLGDALRRAAEQDRGAGAPGDAPGAPDAGATESERPEARARRAAAEAVLRALRCALAAALRVPLKVASPARVPYAAVATVLKARAGRPGLASAPGHCIAARAAGGRGCRAVRAVMLQARGLQARPGRGARAGRIGQPRSPRAARRSMRSWARRSAA